MNALMAKLPLAQSDRVMTFCISPIMSIAGVKIRGVRGDGYVSEDWFR